MSDPQSKLDIFTKIPKEKIIEFGNFFDDGILYKDPSLNKLERILDDDFEIDEVAELVSIFYNFIVGKRNPDKIFGLINTSKLDEDKKKVLKETVQKIHDKTDLDSVSAVLTTNFLTRFGYPHTHGFTAATEFRPISNEKDDLTFNENVKNKSAFDDFIKTNLENPKFKNKFVAFVNGEFQDIGDKRNALIEKMYDKFGNVDMYVDKVTDQKKVIVIDTPEFN